MFRFVAPAGSPIGITCTLRSLMMALGRTGTTRIYQEYFAAEVRARHVFGVSSGRAALCVILTALHRLRPERSLVALPAYTCYTVPASIVRSGLQIYPVDINPETLDFDLSELDKAPEDDLLCVVTSNLFGLVNDLSRIREIACAKGAFVVDDAAQALGAFLDGSHAGTLGDVGFYSLGRGKALAAIEGGIIVTNSDEIGLAVKSEVAKLPAPPLMHEASIFIQMLVYSVFLQPHLYWIPKSMPFLKLGTTEYSPDFAVVDLPKMVRRLLPQLLPKLAKNNQARTRNATLLSTGLATSTDYKIPQPAPKCTPNYVRFPLIARDRTLRVRAVELLESEGIGASAFYPGAICDIRDIGPHMAPKLRHCPKAEDVSQRLFTLPTHSLVRIEDINRVICLLCELSSQ